MAKQDQSEWISTGEAARLLGVSIDTARRMTRDGCALGPPHSRRRPSAAGRTPFGRREVSRASVMQLRWEWLRAHEAGEPVPAVPPPVETLR